MPFLRQEHACIPKALTSPEWVGDEPVLRDCASKQLPLECDVSSECLLESACEDVAAWSATQVRPPQLGAAVKTRTVGEDRVTSGVHTANPSRRWGKGVGRQVYILRVHATAGTGSGAGAPDAGACRRRARARQRRCHTHAAPAPPRTAPAAPPASLLGPPPPAPHASLPQGVSGAEST